MRVLLILNELARHGKRDAHVVARTLAECGIEAVDASGAVDAVVVAGGDGTIVQSLPLVLQRDLPLGVIPLGTFNDLAHTLSLPLQIRQACEVIAAGRIRLIDVARVNGVHYLSEASIGLSSRIARSQTPELKQRFGMLAIAITALRGMRDAIQMRVEIEYDGKSETFRTLQLTIANSGHFGGVIDRPDASIDDGWLDLYSVETRNWLQGFAIARKIAARDPRSGEGLRTRRSQSFRVITRHPHHIAADGEPAGVTPALFELLPRALRVLVP